MKATAIISFITLGLAGAIGAQRIAELKKGPESGDPARKTTAQIKIPGANTRLGAALVYSDLWGVMEGDQYVNPITSGIYSIEAKPGGAVKSIQRLNSMMGMKAGVMVGNVYYTFQSLSGENDYGDVAFITYSGSTWNQSAKKTVTQANLPSDLTYDPVTKKVYGWFYDSEENYFSRFCSLNTSTGEATEVELPHDVRDGHAIAANADGEIYVLWSSLGYLMKLDLNAKTMDRIGRTGIRPDDPSRGYLCSMTFDDTTGKLYLTATAEKKTALYEVNTQTGEASKIMDFDNADTYIGLYALPYETPAAAPAAATDITVNFTTPGALTGKVSFTAPEKDMSGNPLGENLDVIVSVNGAESVVEGVTPGSNASTPEMSFEQGEVNVEVTPCTQTLRGESASYATWAGVDIPGSPLDAILEEKEGKPFVKWGVPTAGMHNGYFDAATLTYKITRYPDKKTVAENLTSTEWIDEDVSKNVSIYYGVTACNAAGESTETQTNKYVFGEGYSIPFMEGFDTQEAFELWSVYDLNGQTTWQYSAKDKNIYSSYATPDYATDDWIISPKVKMEAGKTYALKFDSKVYNKKYPENFSFWLGEAPMPEKMNVKLAEKEEYTNTTWETNRVIFKSPGEGSYYLGIYTNSIPHHWTLYIDNVGIEEVDGRVPAKITDLTVAPGSKGALEATVRFTAPSADSQGGKLDKEMTASIYKNGNSKAVKDVTGLHGGDPVEWTDTDFAESGEVTYRVVCATEAGEGEGAEAKAFVGEDAPGAVRNLKAVETSSGVILSWDVPTEGANGGWFDPAGITYRIVRSIDAEVLAEDCAATTFTDNTLKLNRQELLYYLVTPYKGNVKGAYATTPMEQVYGAPYAAPLSETFPGADMKWYPWIGDSDGSVYVWSLDPNGVNPPVSDQNGDSGLATFISTETTKGITGNFYSPKFSISGIAEPELTVNFFHSHIEGVTTPETLHIYLQTDGGEYEELGEIKRDNGTEGWKRYSYPLAKYSGSQYVRLRLTAKSEGGANMYVDNISLGEKVGSDVELMGMKVQSRTATGVALPITAKVANNGEDAIDKITLTLKEGDTVVASTECGPIEGGSVADVTLEALFSSTGKKNLELAAEYSEDSKPENNSKTLTVNVCEPVMPKPGALEAQVYNDIVNLVWSDPMKHGAVSDDFEDYTDFAIDGIGDWTTADRDYDVTYRINKDLDEYPYANDAKAWQVCNAAKLGINIWEQGTPHSGDKMMMALACVNRSNDDWLISPMLNGGAQTISFHAKSFTTDEVPAERMQVYYSTGSVTPEDFIPLTSGYVEIPESWTELSYDLPECARYFAVRCVSENAFALFLDDAVFNDLTVPVAKVSTYEVYRDGEKIASVNEPEYTDDSRDYSTMKHTYYVKAIFDNGMETQGESVSIELSALDSIGIDGMETVEVYSVDGMYIGKKAIDELPAGVYLVKTPRGMVKVVR